MSREARSTVPPSSRHFTECAGARNRRAPRRINEIVLGKRSITADTALRLSTFFGLSDTFWTNLQTRFDLDVEREELQATLDRIIPLQRAS